MTILAPTEPGKVIAVGLNYRDHLGSTDPAKYPGLFAKFPTCIIAQGETVVLPGDTKTVAAEAEIVIVIGKKAHNVSIKEALHQPLRDAHAGRRHLHRHAGHRAKD